MATVTSYTKAGIDSIIGSAQAAASLWTPSVNGLIAATGDPMLALSSSAPGAGAVICMQTTVPTAVAATKFGFILKTAGVTVTNSFGGIYDATTGDLLGETADLSSTLMGTTGNFLVALSSSVNLAENQKIYLALLVGSAATVPILANFGGGQPDFGYVSGNRRAANAASGATALPATATFTTNVSYFPFLAVA